MYSFILPKISLNRSISKSEIKEMNIKTTSLKPKTPWAIYTCFANMHIVQRAILTSTPNWNLLYCSQVTIQTRSVLTGIFIFPQIYWFFFYIYLITGHTLLRAQNYKWFLEKWKAEKMLKLQWTVTGGSTGDSGTIPTLLHAYLWFWSGYAPVPKYYLLRNFKIGLKLCTF